MEWRIACLGGAYLLVNPVDSSATDPSDGSSFPKSDVRYWKARLMERKYVEAIKLVSGREYSTRIEHEGSGCFFPLESGDESRAAARALEIYSTVTRRGWQAAFEIHPREVTVAVFWLWSPFACTYTTLYTAPARRNLGSEGLSRTRKRSCPVGIVEADRGVSRALAHWIARQPGFQFAAAWGSVKEAIAALPDSGVRLALVSRDLVERPGGEPLEAVRLAAPRTAVFAMGAYEESNYIFHSVTGVKAGYCMRRVAPDHLFEPMARLAHETAFDNDLIATEVKQYFKAMFDLPASGERETDLANLTGREREILLCLSKGFTDKEIADALNISVWTVHGHAKKIFEKLRVHSRTEAVIKFLQK